QANQLFWAPNTKRDPFVSLVKPINDPKAAGSRLRPPGFPGFDISEMRLEGTIQAGQDNGGNQSFLKGPDGKSYRQRVGDATFNGKIVAIRDDRVVFEEYQFDTTGKPRPPKIVTLFLERRPNR
ncbi:MAG: hypothetical protein ACOYKK_08730, partial [Microbacteriaceae bacterium]